MIQRLYDTLCYGREYQLVPLCDVNRRDAVDRPTGEQLCTGVMMESRHVEQIARRAIDDS